jgi:hypothetical protein
VLEQVSSEVRLTSLVDAVTEAEWNRLIDRFADANIYQTWAYGAASWGENQLSHLVLQRNGTPVAIAQVRILRLPVVRSGIAYVRWGPLCRLKGSQFDPAAWEAVTKALIDEYVERRRLMLRVRPCVFRQDSEAATLSSIWKIAGLVESPAPQHYETLRVDVTPSLDAIRRNLAHKWRNQLNAAERNGLEVCQGTTRELFDEFMQLYGQMMARKQFATSANVDRFLRMQDCLPPSQKMIVLIARANGQALSGIVASDIGATGQYLFGATGDEGLKAKGSYLLQWQVLRRLHDRGCQWYDLGGISRQTNPGVYHFKEGMSGHEAIHVGCYESDRYLLSRLTISAAEGLRRFAGRFRANDSQSASQRLH